MSRSRRPERPLLSGPAPFLTLLLCAFGAWALAPASCSSKPPEPPPEHVYTVRGRIEALPDGTALSDLTINHEEIPDFVDEKGKRTGMRTMIMVFKPAEGLDLSALKVGDPVEFTWELRWTPPRYYRISRITRLPDGTALRIGER